MEIVIKMDDRAYKNLMTDNGWRAIELAKAIKNGMPLPKGHGRLIDAGDLMPDSDYEDGIFYAVSIGQIYSAPTIIEMDAFTRTI